jgi:hypothetical protein
MNGRFGAAVKSFIICISGIFWQQLQYKIITITLYKYDII